MTGKMGSKLSSWLSLLLLGSGIHAYFDAGEATIPAAIETFIPTIPHHLSRLEYATVTFGANALISAVAPLVTAKPNGGYETYYSMHYNRGAPAQRDRLGKGIFKRGVFADDPPFPTCTPCDGSGSASITRTFNGSTTFSSAPECTTIPYNGVFRSRDPDKTSYCFGSSYSGIFSTTPTYSYTLPCCFTTPSNCLANQTSSTTSYSFTSGVFVSSTTFTNNFTVSTFTAPPSSSLSLSRSSSTSRSGSGSSGSSVSASSMSGGGIGPGSQTASSSNGSSRSTLTTTTSGATQSGVTISTSSFSIIVISSTTITLSAPSTSGSVLTVITPSSGTATSTLLSGSTTSGPPVTTAPATVIGCGSVASGSGTVVGSGTVYLAMMPFMSVVSSGTAIGSAPLVIGCGTMYGTGTFTGDATITGCGEGFGSATMSGSGTVCPAIGGIDQTRLCFTSSGVVSGSGRVKGCGTLIGSGTFTVTSPTPLVTVTEYVSYCGPVSLINPAIGLKAIGANGTFNGNLSRPATPSQAGPDYLVDSHFHNDTVPFALLNSTRLANMTANSTSEDLQNPGCISCPNSGGICCPKDTPCDAQGHCPWEGIVAMGYLRQGLNMVMRRNMSDGTQISDGGVAPEAAGFGGAAAGDGAIGVEAMGGKGMLEQWGGTAGRAANHLAGGSVGSVLAKRDRESRREREEREIKARGLGVAKRSDFLVGGDDLVF